MKPIILTPNEVRAALAGTLTEIRRPVDMRGIRETAWITRCTVDPDDNEAEFSGDVDYFVRRVKCSFGAPGDVLFGQEDWVLEFCGDDGQRVIWAEDRAAAWVEAPGTLGAVHYLESNYEPGHWAAPVTMPLWASRLALVTRSVRVERADGWTWVASVEVVRKPNGEPMPPREVKR